MTNMNNALFLGGYELILILFFSLLFFLLPIYFLVDLLRINSSSNSKLIWVIILIALPILGSILYVAIGKKAIIEGKY
jgi:choline-glycine betaine transporter